MIKSIPFKKGEGKMEDKTQLMLSGTTVFKGDKMIGSLDDSVTRGLLWIRDDIKYATITVDVGEGDGKVTSEMVRSFTELVPRIENETWKLTNN
jgi:spore germination protein KC